MTNPEIINCYYYAPHNHTLLNKHLEADIEHIASLGTDCVSICVQESQITNWHQQRLRNAVACIHKHGMTAHAVPNRWAGLFAGWLDGFGRFTVENMDTLIQPEKGKFSIKGPLASCVNNPKVQQHMRTSLEDLFKHFDFDGLVWDEPHPAKCYCDYCDSLRDPTDPDWEQTRFAQYVDEITQYAQSLKPGLVTSLFIQPDQEPLLRALLAKNSSVDFLGSDGHIRENDHQMHRMKGTIFEAHDDFDSMIKSADKKSFFLLEAQRHRDEDLEHYLECVDRAFSLPIDHLMYYYSAHEMSADNENTFNEATWNAIRRLHAKRTSAKA